MPKFSYKAKNPNGQLVTGAIEAVDTKAVSGALRAQRLFVIDIHENLLFSFFSTMMARIRGGIGLSEITNFTRQISVMISSGLTISESLTVLHNQTEDTRFQKLLFDLLQGIEGGMSFSKALAQHTEVFPRIYIAYIASGEKSGVLDKLLNRLADNLEKEREFRGKIKVMLLYPLIILIGIGIVITIMMLFVVPQLAVVYDQFNLELPLNTKIIIGTSKFFVAFWFLIPLFLVGGYMAFSSWRRTEAGRLTFATFILKLPIWGKIETATNLTEIARTLGLMAAAGTPIIDALTEVGGATKNPLFAGAILRSAKKVEKGVAIAVAFSQESILPPLVSQMTRVGEETGKLDEVMAKMSNYYEAEVERALKAVPTVLEPVMLAVLGVIIGFLMLSLFMPIYGLTKAF